MAFNKQWALKVFRKVHNNEMCQYSNCNLLRSMVILYLLHIKHADKSLDVKKWKSL